MTSSCFCSSASKVWNIAAVIFPFIILLSSNIVFHINTIVITTLHVSKTKIILTYSQLDPSFATSYLWKHCHLIEHYGSTKINSQSLQNQHLVHYRCLLLQVHVATHILSWVHGCLSTDTTDHPAFPLNASFTSLWKASQAQTFSSMLQ